jgi:oxaloacetate decarboxylase alpha subunit
MKVHFTETVLRDGNQSLLATRLPFERFEPILSVMDQVGYHSVECWGGATFDACLRYLDEDPWERLRRFRKAMPNTKLKMLLRGQNILGYKHYPDDVVRRFIQSSINCGIDIIRIFDALNDVRNMETSINETKKHNVHASCDIAYTVSPVHTPESFVNMAKTLEKMGADSISIKDMAGLLDPKTAFDLVRAIKDSVNLPVVVHTHCMPGLGFMTYLKAVEAGADVIETSTSPLAGGASQPATETMVYTLDKLGYDVNLSLEKLQPISDFFKVIRDESIASGLLTPLALVTDTDCLTYQIPGGMISNLIQQLKTQNATDKLQEVLEETPRVRADLGYPPLVTPTSQMVGVQAVLNVLTGERYKVVSQEIKAYVRGEYGVSPSPISSEIVKKIIRNETPIQYRFADSLKPAFENAKKALAATDFSDEDVLSHILFPILAEQFYEKRRPIYYSTN